MAQRTTSRSFTCTWRIENFVFCPQRKGEYISSPSFSPDAFRQHPWCLDLYPRGIDDANIVVCCLKGGGTLISKRKIACELSILAVNGGSGIREEFCDKNIRLEVSRHYLLKMSRSAFLPQGTLTVRFRILNAQVQESVHLQAMSRVGVDRTCFTWVLNPFSTHVPVCNIPSVSKKDSALQMYFALSGDFDKRVRITVANKDARCRFLTCKVAVVNSCRNLAFSEMGEHLLFHDWRFPTTLKVQQLMDRKDLYLPYDKLSLRCELAVSTGVVFEEIETTLFGDPSLRFPDPFQDTAAAATSSQETRATLKDDLYCSYIEGRHCDVILSSEDDLFPVHRSVLCSRSPIFASILEEFEDARENVFRILSVDSQTVSRLLTFLYTDSTDDLGLEATLKLYSAANKYQVGSLISYCLSVLKSLLSVMNVDRILMFADAHGDHELKTAAQSFIQDHRDELHSTEDWMSIVQQNPELAAETKCVLSDSSRMTQEIDEADVVTELMEDPSDFDPGNLDVGGGEDVTKHRLTTEDSENTGAKEPGERASKFIKVEIPALKQNTNENESSTSDTKLGTEVKELPTTRKMAARPETDKDYSRVQSNTENKNETDCQD